MKIIGFDFSINKPAACIYEDGNYQFMSWPFGLSEKIKNIYKESGVNLIDRLDEKYKGTDSSEKMRWEVSNARYLSNLIISSLPDGETKNWKIVFEGLSFASSGNVVLQLGGYKYILMNNLFDEGIPFENMTTYAPITIKKTAGCSKKGMTKKDMIDAFVASSCDHPLKYAIRSNRELFMKKGMKNYIDHLDDLVDSYWAIQTYIEKEMN
jgi:hypothetical protein